MEYSSDDDSAASSGDEMLNMVVPFSQDSAALKVKGKKSESDVSGDEKEAASKKRKRTDNDDDNNDNKSETEDNDKVALVNATNAFKIQFNDQKIGATNKLFWNERKQKKNAALYPCRVVPREEVVGLSLKDWDTETERAVQYIQFPHQQIKRDLGLYEVVTLRSLTPYQGDGPEGAWCSKRIQQYFKQLKRTLKGGLSEIDLLTEEAFLNLVLQQSLKEEENERERALLDKAAPEESEASDKEDEQSDNDSDDDDVGGDDRRSRLCRSNNVKTEPLRVGDVIEYYRPLSVAGNPDALCQAEVKFINPKGDPILITSDVFTLLPAEHQVKRVKRMQRGKLLDHNGRFRAINSYILKKEGNPNAAKEIIAEKTTRTKATIQRAKDELTSRMDDGGFFPRDLIRN